MSPSRRRRGGRGGKPTAQQLRDFWGEDVDDPVDDEPIRVITPGVDPTALVESLGPLPRQHGYPARLIVPGLYGYVSATKWLAELELTTLEAFDAYWVPRGWAKEAPILTQ